FHEEAQCLRCHHVNGFGGSAGPNLSDVGARLSRSDLIESIVEPNAKVNPRYGQVSTMREMQGILKPTEIRDIVAYLSTLGVAPESSAVAHASGPAPSRRIVLLAPVALVGTLGLFLFLLVATVRVPRI
ncbi:MAG: cytochrome c, partial [Phycisphaerales bacterium]|nr:cytochrome c [Phycisphaerales bacterium]